MSESTGAVGLVLLSGLIHSVWNLFAKQSDDKIHFLWWSHIFGLIVFLPFMVAALTEHGLPVTAIPTLVASMAIHAVYTILLARSYSVGHLSKVYPIMRGTSPMLVPILGVVLLGEYLSIASWLAVIAIVVGIVSLTDFGFHPKSITHDRAFGLALGVGVCIAGYTIVDKYTLEQTQPIVIGTFGHLANFAALSYWAERGKPKEIEWKLNRWRIVIGGIIAPAGYLLFLHALSMAPASVVAPMREIGTVFASLFGVFLLDEGNARRRMIASTLITAGVIILGLHL